MRVLIVAKTHMQQHACVGGLALDRQQSVRLMQADGSPQPGDSAYEVGDIWEVEGRPPPSIRPPHVEDMWVLRARKVGQEVQMRRFLLEHVQPWRGPIGVIFDGLVRYTYSGHGYINNIMGVPGMSTGYWVPDKPLHKVVQDEKTYFRYLGVKGACLLPYVGYAPDTDLIPQNALLRLSLARWWKPEGADIEERCYLQLSGWYL